MQISSILTSVQDLLGGAADKARKAAETPAGASFSEQLQTFAVAAEGVRTNLKATPEAEVDAGLRTRIANAGKAFEAQMLSTMMQSMFNGVGGGQFSGGEGEKQFKSLLIDAYAKQTVKTGGLGIADQVAREMLKMQGLTDAPAASPAQTA